MEDTIRAVDYFYVQVEDKPDEGRRMLEHLSEKGVNLISFTAFPVGGGKTQLDFVPESADSLRAAAADANITVVGPKKAIFIQGDDRVGALHQYLLTLANAGVNVHAANGASSGMGGFSFIIWVAPGDFEDAKKALNI